MAMHHCMGLLLLPLFVVPVASHGFLSKPPARNIPNSPKNGYCAHCGNGNTNVCGDGNQWPRSSDYWKYTGGPVTEVGDDGILDIEIVITAHHKGHLEFSICESQINGGTGTANQDCLNKHVLQRVPPEEIHGSDCLVNDLRPSCQPMDENYPERFYLPPPKGAVTTLWTTQYNGKDTYQLKYYVPDSITCQGSCTLQWRWFTANSCVPKPNYKCYFDKIKQLGWNSELYCGSFCGTCSGGSNTPNKYTRGCGEEFANCADIVLARSGSGPSPPATPMPPQTPAPTVAPCGSCGACMTPDGTGCITDKSHAWCAQMNYKWCGPPPPTDAPTPAPPPPPTLAPTPAPPGTGCRAVPGMNAGATDSNCAKCATGYQWWPCNSQPAICDCSGSSPTPASPTPTPTPTSGGGTCGSCGACLATNDVCYDQEKSWCDQYDGIGYIWCGSGGGGADPSPTPTAAPATPAPSAAPSPAPSAAPTADTEACAACDRPGLNCVSSSDGSCFPASESVCSSVGGTWCGGSALAQGRAQKRKVRRHFLGRRGSSDEASMMQLQPGMASDEESDDFEDAGEYEGSDEL